MVETEVNAYNRFQTSSTLGTIILLILSNDPPRHSQTILNDSSMLRIPTRK